MLGWDESCSPLARWERNTKSFGTEVCIVNSYVLTNESKPIFLYLPLELWAMLWSPTTRTTRRDWTQIWEVPIFQAALLSSQGNDPFLPIGTGQGSGETLPWLPTNPCSGQQVTLSDRRFLMSCQGHISQHKGWALIVLVSSLNIFLANEKIAVASILSPLILVSSFFCFLGYCYQLCPWLPLCLRRKAFLVQPVLCQSLLFFRSTAHL